MDALLWRILLAFAVLFLAIAAWRVLEMTLGPILAPLIMGLALAICAGLLAFLESRRRKKLAESTPTLAPLLLTLVEIAFAPKVVRWMALGNLLIDVLSGESPLSKSKSKRK